MDRTRAIELVREGGRIAGVRLATPAGEREVRARVVVGADGRRSMVARMVDAPVEESAPPYRALYYRYVRGYTGPSGTEPDGAEFSHIEDELAYVFPSDDGVTCIALSINAAEFPAMRRSAARGFRERIARHRGIAGRFAAAVPEGRILGCGPEPNYVRAPFGPGWALVGDAGMHQDPWSGMGMDMAGVHARFLAEALLDRFGGMSSEGEAMASYHERRNEHGLEPYRQTVTLAADLRRLAGD
jgi:flavin-dependent dehydrogenase